MPHENAPLREAVSRIPGLSGGSAGTRGIRFYEGVHLFPVFENAASGIPSGSSGNRNNY